ncbi:phage minor head protein [Intestinimonas butyriciproducens]|uniref:phage minor head protein n=1 Tax=Intestinimonas butyriciproducens TaxID=1297617 RepID=UPI00189F21E6|nr:phage minor head protein [Intestinimonas butyriciproducens]
MKCNCGPLIKAINAYIAKADNDLEEALAEAGFLDPEGTLTEISTLEEKVAAALTTETDYLLDALKDSIDLEAFIKDIWPKLKAEDAVAQDLFDIFLEEFEGYMTPLASEYIAQTDAELTVETVSKRTTAWVKSWSQELADIMMLDGHTMIENILTSAMEEGQSVAEVTQAILDSGIRDEYYRARRVAVTETLRAHSVASQEAMMQSPSVEEKEWKHTGAYRNQPRRNHVSMSGQRVPKGEPFVLEGADGNTYYPAYPRDSILPPGESVNCHCISQPIVSEEALGLPIEERRRLQAEAIAEMDDEWEKELDAKNKAASGL